MYTEKTIRRRAREIGYEVRKGKTLPTDTESGYMVVDVEKNVAVWGCYNDVYSYLWTLEDVESFLKAEYEERKMKW